MYKKTKFNLILYKIFIMSEEQKQDPQQQKEQPQNATNEENAQPQEQQPKTVQKKITDLINVEVAKQLQEMGFSKNVSEKACLFTQSNIEQAVEWISQHSNDPDFEEEAIIEVSEEKPKPQMSKEEAAIKAKELQERMRKIHEEKQKELDREHEKMRIQNTKEMLKAKQAEEERQARLFVELKKKREKEDAEARRQVLEQIERDKMERLGKKYVPPEKQEQKVYTKEENIQYFIKTLKTLYNPFRAGDTLKNCLKTIKIILNNILKNPNEDKFKSIKLSNPNVYERVGKINIALKMLEELGFVKEDEVMKVKEVNTDLFNKTIEYLEAELSQLD